jgi:hypothetical protein
MGDPLCPGCELWCDARFYGRNSREWTAEIESDALPGGRKAGSGYPLVTLAFKEKCGYNISIHYQRGKASFWNGMLSAPPHRLLTLPALTFSHVKSESIPGWSTMRSCEHSFGPALPGGTRRDRGEDVTAVRNWPSA